MYGTVSIARLLRLQNINVWYWYPNFYRFLKFNETKPDIITKDLTTYVQQELKLEDDIGAVIVGYDEHISFPKLAKALNYLQNPDCLFIATNNDPTKKAKNPELKVPGAGTFVNMLKVCALREPVYMGKPNDFMRETILANPKVEPGRTLMIGDKPSTDILLGKRCGFATLMVLSGTTTLDEVTGWSHAREPTLSQLVPDYYVATLGALLPRLLSTCHDATVG